MSKLLNGNDRQNHSYVYAVEHTSQVGEARRFAMQLSSILQFDEIRQARVSIVVNELGNNLVKYSKDGRLIFRSITLENQRGIEILSVDRGPGLDIDAVMVDGYTTGDTPGTGLGAVKRQSDEFDVYSDKRTGTVLLSKIYADDHSAKSESKFEVAAVNIPVKGEVVSGDGWSVHTNGNGLEVIVVDGLGHGPLASKAASEAVEAFDRSSKEPLDFVLKQVHGRLKSTRGGAVFLVAAKESILDFTGVGNIRAVIQQPARTKTLISQNGTAGLQMRTTRTLSEPWDGIGDIILHSDGISSRWDLSKYPGLQSRHPSLVAGVIYRDFSRGTDDSTVVVIRRHH